MCVYVTIIVIILQVTLWCMGSAPAFKCNVGIMSWGLGWQGTLRKTVYIGGGGPVCIVQGSVH